MGEETRKVSKRQKWKNDGDGPLAEKKTGFGWNRGAEKRGSHKKRGKIKTQKNLKTQEQQPAIPKKKKKTPT